MLDTVQQSLDKETAELDDLANHMKTGSKLVREKERKLRHLRNRFYTDVCIYSQTCPCSHLY